MSEHSIIFNSEMVRAILEGRKTETRRVIKNKWGYTTEDWNNALPHNGEKAVLYQPCYLKVCPRNPNYDEGYIQRRIVPLWDIGDRLWVKETWQFGSVTHLTTEPYRSDILYKADEKVTLPTNIKWRSPIFMPRWVSRISLEITEVRVEKLQKISQRDIIAEGIEDSQAVFGLSPFIKFMKLWDSLNAKRGYGWDVNPWCWCISFKRID